MKQIYVQLRVYSIFGLTNKIYSDFRGIVHERLKCSIDTCICLQGVTHKKRKDGSKYYVESTTCNKHRKDGSFHPSTTPEAIRESHWKEQGIFLSYEEYTQLLDLQGGKCAICGIDASELKRAIDVEHCHQTGRIRGLICRRCNNAIGWIERVMTLDELKTFLQGDVFEKYSDTIFENESCKALRSKQIWHKRLVLLTTQ